MEECCFTSLFSGLAFPGFLNSSWAPAAGGTFHSGLDPPKSNIYEKIILQGFLQWLFSPFWVPPFQMILAWVKLTKNYPSHNRFKLKYQSTRLLEHTLAVWGILLSVHNFSFLLESRKQVSTGSCLLFWAVVSWYGFQEVLQEWLEKGKLGKQDRRLAYLLKHGL